jgi:hypothetical protein
MDKHPSHQAPEILEGAQDPAETGQAIALEPQPYDRGESGYLAHCIRVAGGAL